MFRSAIVSFAALCLSVSCLAAQGSRDELVVSPRWLAGHLHDKNLVLLHVGDEADYPRGHIPGARYLDFRTTHQMQDPVTKLTLEELPLDSLRTNLASLGISDDSRIVVYYAKDWVSIATRVILTLDHAGFGHATSLLDGGMAAWTRAGYPISTDATPTTRGTLSPLKPRQVIVTADFVRDNIGKPGIAVIDGRDASFYDGVSEGGPRDARKKGHIKGALSVPFTSITNDELQLRSADELAALFRNAGVKSGDTIIGYCHIGQQATAMLFAARTLGYKVFLYDGSFEDWARRGWPVEASARNDK